MTTPLMSQTQARLKRSKRRWAGGINKVARAGQAGARRAPVPPRMRAGLGGMLGWSPTLREVPLDKLLMGGQSTMNARDYATATDDLLWPSGRVVDGPHARLLSRAMAGPLDDDAIRESAYAVMARRCIVLSGRYFAAVDEDGIIDVARDFIASALDGHVAGGAPMPHQSPPGMPVRVARIMDSDCYQVVDGHHRVAALALTDADTIPVQASRVAVHTPLQTLLHRMSWIGGENELYQPVHAPEVSLWPTVRRCDDRLAAMAELLGEGFGATSTYLDVASCYGWFVAGMRDLGYDAEGVERDPLAPTLGSAVYGLDPQHVITADAVEFLSATNSRWDVVSCFSLLHHFALGRGAVDAPSLVRLLDKVTGSVLFLDTGQDHERWFADSLAGWDTAGVQAFLERETSFDRVVDLGPDQDDQPPYDGNYGRHLFACIRER